MTAKLFVLTLVSVVLLSSCGDSDAPQVYTGFPLELGAVWLSSDYVNELNESYSPMRALGAVSDDRVAMTMRVEGPKMILTTLSRFNDRMVDTVDISTVKGQWHKGPIALAGEGDPSVDSAAAAELVAGFDEPDKVRSTILPVNNMQLVLADDGLTEKLRVEFDDSGSFIDYTRIEGGTGDQDYTIDNYVGGVILEGTFENETGSQTIFTADGEVAWEGQGRYYTLLLGDRITDCDVIILADNESGAGPHEIYGFERSADGLDLYATSLDDDNNIRCSNAMLMSLSQK